MHSPRAYFVPSCYLLSLYLCGGATTAMEVFCLLTSEFMLLPLSLAEESSALTVVRGHDLIVITITHISQWALRSDTAQLVMGQSHPFCNVWSAAPPLVVGDKVYIVDSFDICRSFSLDSGRVVDEVG